LNPFIDSESFSTILYRIGRDILLCLYLKTYREYWHCGGGITTEPQETDPDPDRGFRIPIPIHIWEFLLPRLGRGVCPTECYVVMFILISSENNNALLHYRSRRGRFRHVRLNRGPTKRRRGGGRECRTAARLTTLSGLWGQSPHRYGVRAPQIWGQSPHRYGVLRHKFAWCSTPLHSLTWGLI